MWYGAVLSQQQEGIEQVIAYGSHTLTKSERNYSTTRKELLALVYFLQHFRCYLLGHSFVVRTDHSTHMAQAVRVSLLGGWSSCRSLNSKQNTGQESNIATLMLSLSYIRYQRLLFTVLKCLPWSVLGLCHGPVKSCNRLRQQILHLVLSWLG